MPSLVIFGSFFLFLLFGYVKSKETLYTPIPVENVTNVYKYEEHAYCDFFTAKCSWSASEAWTWNSRVDEIDPVQFDGSLGRSRFRQYNVISANSKTQKDFQLREFFTSPELEAPTDKKTCFSFSYYTRLGDGTNDGLTLYVVDANDENNKTAIWARGGSDMDCWLRKELHIPTDKNYKLSFKAYGQHGFVGLSDFYLTDCAGWDSFECFFEGGMCHGWTTDGFKVVKAASTKFQNPIDHTSHSKFDQFALYTSSESIRFGQAQLSSPEIGPYFYREQCLTFFFKRTSRDVSLSLQTKFTGNGTLDTLWMSNDTYLLHQWIGVQQMITVDEKMKFILEATFSNSSDVDDSIAIDDLTLMPRKCETLVTCSFLDTFCGWEPNGNASHRWSIGHGRVEQADKLKEKAKIKNSDTRGSPAWFAPEYYEESVVYSDFTMISNNETASMELISQLIPPHPDGGYCFLIDVNVISLESGDEFSISQLNSHDERRAIWNFKDLNLKPGSFWQRGLYIWIPNLSAHEPSRLTLTAKSSHASTRIAFDEVDLLGNNRTLTYQHCKKAAGVSTTPPL